jgi:hypothetical protein
MVRGYFDTRRPRRGSRIVHAPSGAPTSRAETSRGDAGTAAPRGDDRHSADTGTCSRALAGNLDAPTRSSRSVDPFDLHLERRRARRRTRPARPVPRPPTSRHVRRRLPDSPRASSGLIPSSASSGGRRGRTGQIPRRRGTSARRPWPPTNRRSRHSIGAGRSDRRGKGLQGDRGRVAQARPTDQRLAPLTKSSDSGRSPAAPWSVCPDTTTP